jgi:aspartate aminotransferase
VAGSPGSSAVEGHILDALSLGKIVQIREQLLKAQAGGAKVFRLESGDPNFSLAPHVLHALCQAAEMGKTHYIPNAGIPELRAELAKKCVERNSIANVLPSQIYVTNGAMHGLFSIFQCLLNAGDEVIVPDPMWTEVVENIKLARGVPVGVPLNAMSNFEYTAAEVEKRITPKTKVLFLNTPHNPTGALLSKETLVELGELAQKHGLWIVSDEAYEDVVFAPYSHMSIASLFPEYSQNIVSVFSFSKSYAMSGLRTGYLVVQNQILDDRLQKILRCSINGVNSVAQWTALAAISGNREQSLAQQNFMRKEYSDRREILLAELGKVKGFKPFVPRGSFFVWCEIDPAYYEQWGVQNADGLSALLASQGVGSSPGDAFGSSCDNAIRFAFSCETSMVREGAQKIVEILNKTAPL